MSRFLRIPCKTPSDVPIAECWYVRPDAPSCSSLAMCDPRTADHQVGPTTPMAPMTSRSGLRWCSSAPLSCWIYPRTVTAQWSELECKNFISLPPRPSSLWLPASMCWGESRSSPCFWTGTRHLLSPTSTVSTNGPNSYLAVLAQIRPTQQAGWGAMCMR